MSDPDKRVYRSDLRDEQARRTRRKIVAAAAVLFTDKGFPATTIDAVAQASGVSRKTVFTSVGGKVQLLKLAYDYAMAGDDEPFTMVERPALRQVIEIGNTDPYRAFELWGELVTASAARISPLYLALRGAAEVDAEAGELYRRWERERVAGMRRGPVELLLAGGLLRPEVTPDEAAGILALLLDPSIYHRLVVDGDWSAERFSSWLTRTMIEQVITPRDPSTHIGARAIHPAQSLGDLVSPEVDHP